MQMGVTGGVLQDLAWPTHLSAMNSKVAANLRRPNEAFVLTTDEAPYSVAIEQQIQEERNEDEQTD